MGQIAGGGADSGDGPALLTFPQLARIAPRTACSPSRTRSAWRGCSESVFLWLVLGPRPTAGRWRCSSPRPPRTGSTARSPGRSESADARLGEALDPAADRLYIAATLVGLAVRAIIPWWLVALLAARELIVAGALGLLKRKVGFGTLQVSFAGKTATLCLLYAFPLLLLGAYAGTGAEIARIIAWAFAIWGTALYWWAAALYLTQAHALLTGRVAADPDPGRSGETVEGRRHGRR